MSTRETGTILSAPIVAGEDTTVDMASAFNNELQGAVQRFPTISARDAWSGAYKSRAFNSTALVEDGGSGSPKMFKWTGNNQDGSDGSWEEIPLGSGGGSGITGITVTEDGTAFVGVGTLQTEQMEVSEPSPGTVKIRPLVRMSEFGGNYGQWDVGELTVQWPLKFAPRTTVENGPVTMVQVDIDHGAYARAGAPTYLAYIQDPTDVFASIESLNGHSKGTLWFDDVVSSGSVYLVSDKENKSYGIQEADHADPNVSGGTNYLIAFRAHMEGVAQEDGSVRIYLAKRAYNDLQADGYLLDIEGQPMVVERAYKAGDALGSLQVVGVVNATAMQEFTCHVVHSFKKSYVTLTDRTEGGTGLLIQGITSINKTGDGLLQFELDTNQHIKLSSHLLGNSRLDTNWLIRNADPIEKIPANTYSVLSDGFIVQTLSKAEIGKMDDHLHFGSDGEPLDFYFGKVFSSEETQMMRGKTIQVSTTLTNTDSAWRVGLFKWTGIPDKATHPIYTRTNGALVEKPNWVPVGTMDIIENPLERDHLQIKNLLIPTDAVNYAVVIYPVSVDEPSALQLKQLRVDVVPPFIGVAITGLENLDQIHLRYSDEHKHLVQDTQGYASLRYTINASEIPLPCGELKEGLADIAIDTSVNQISGSMAHGGEGAIKFIANGNATISTKLQLFSEKAVGTPSVIHVWYSKVAGDGTLTKIPASEASFTILGGNKNYIVSLPTFELNIAANDRIVLRAQGDSADAGFLQCNSDVLPLLDTVIDFKEA